jgi:hypothetical protein
VFSCQPDYHSEDKSTIGSVTLSTVGLVDMPFGGKAGPDVGRLSPLDRSQSVSLSDYPTVFRR